jgi:ubiquinone/menaquinone biosynthesis C-methylase UbiE
MLNPFVKAGDSHPLVVGMVGTKMGERFVQIGCAHGGRLGAVAVKVGLSGRAVAITPDEESAERARKGAAQAGMLVEVEVAPLTALPAEDRAFDVAVIDDTGGLLGEMRPDDRRSLVRELFRIVRPGGRVVALGATPRSGLSALLKRGPAEPSFAASGALHELLAADGFRPVRTLAERDGLVFVEAARPREREMEMAGGAGKAG